MKDPSVNKASMLAALMAAFMPGQPFYKKHSRYLERSKKIRFSVHSPHQGEREKARRRRQIERGILKPGMLLREKGEEQRQ